MPTLLPSSRHMYRFPRPSGATELLPRPGPPSSCLPAPEPPPPIDLISLFPPPVARPVHSHPSGTGCRARPSASCPIPPFPLEPELRGRRRLGDGLRDAEPERPGRGLRPLRRPLRHPVCCCPSLSPRRHPGWPNPQAAEVKVRSVRPVYSASPLPPFRDCVRSAAAAATLSSPPPRRRGSLRRSGSIEVPELRSYYKPAPEVRNPPPPATVAFL